MEIRHSINSRFLSFSLVAQEIIALIFATYSFSQGEIKLVFFYISVATIISIALTVFYICQCYSLARVLLATTLLCGFLFLLIDVSDETSLMWCLTAVPTLVGVFGYRQSLLLVSAVFAGSLWIMISGAVPVISYQYEDIMIMRFLSCYAILATVSIAMDNSLITRFDTYNLLSSKAHEIAHRDPLTKLPNRHNMEGLLKLKAREHQLANSIFSIVLADLDNFKPLNHRYGREAGDKILQETAQLLSDELRDQDTVARWGGKQFILLLPNTNNEEAAKIAERLRIKVNHLSMEVEGDNLNISISMGVASIEKCFDLDDLISGAENGIYQAKHMGRNMVVIS